MDRGNQSPPNLDQLGFDQKKRKVKDKLCEELHVSEREETVKDMRAKKTSDHQPNVQNATNCHSVVVTRKSKLSSRLGSKRGFYPRSSFQIAGCCYTKHHTGQARV